MFSFTYLSCDIASTTADETNSESIDIPNDTDKDDSNKGNDSETDHGSNTDNDSGTDNGSNGDSGTDSESNDDSDSEPVDNPAFPVTRATVSIPEGALIVFDSDKRIDKINNTAIWGNATLSNVTVDGKTVKKYELGSGNDKAFGIALLFLQIQIRSSI